MIRHIKSINFKSDKGFSLVEVLLGTVITISATVIVLSIIISAFRISSKTTTNSVIRQNGNYVISQTSRMLQFADSFNSITCNGNTLTNCNTAQNSCSQINITYNGASKILSCSGTDSILRSIDSTIVSSNCKFTCRQNIDESPIIGIGFSLAIGGTDDVVENRSSIDFSTSVKMRNL